MAVWCRPKSVRASLGCGLGCRPALSVSHSADAAAVCGLWRYKSTMAFFLKMNGSKNQYGKLQQDKNGFILI